ncbi:MAG: PAS domain-containing protein [Halodesulfurarchaeum sp.]|nr:PAS domain-containing protein [Halodesulfurarchaeum sp.]
MAPETADRIDELEAQIDELEAVRDKLISALKATNTYAWEWNLETDTVDRYPSFEALFDVDASELEPIFENFVDRVPAGYRDDVVAAFERAIDEGTSYHVQYPLKLASGEIWLEGQGDVVTEPGEPVRIIGTTRQIPEPETEL